MVIIDNKTSTLFNEEVFSNLFRIVAEGEKFHSEAEVNLLLCDDGRIKDYNRRFLGKNKITDVLSFPVEIPFIPLLGDIVIDIKVADAQKGKKTLEEEVVYLFLHGLLHLAGYDHLSTVMAMEMNDKEKYYWKLFKEL